jgi:hypothetical protein
MKKIIIIGILSLLITSCVAPYSTYDYTPRYNQYQYQYQYQYPYTYQPTRVIVFKHKHIKQSHKKHKKHKRHVKVRINKHR